MSSWHKPTDYNAGGGHPIPEKGAGVKWAIDCPSCKYGTIVPFCGSNYVCIDCGALFERFALIDMGVIRK